MKTKALILVGMLIIAFAATVSPVMAAKTGTTIITGNAAKQIALTVNGGDITGWILDPDLSPYIDSTSNTLTVHSNSPGWVVSVKDGMDGSKTAGSEGKMVQYTIASTTYGSTVLNSAMDVGSATVPGLTGATVTLTGSDQAIETGASDATGRGSFTATALTFTQPVAYTDPVLGAGDVYRIMITFTGTTP